MSLRPVYTSLSDASGGAKSKLIPTNWIPTPFQMTLKTIVTGTVVYSVQYTCDDIRASTFVEASANWTAITDMDGAAAGAEKTLISPITCLRLLLSSGTGTVALQAVAAG